MLNFRFDEMHHRRQISSAKCSQSSLELSISRLLTVLAWTACLVVLSDYILSVLSWGHGTLAKNKQFVKKSCEKPAGQQKEQGYQKTIWLFPEFRIWSMEQNVKVVDKSKKNVKMLKISYIAKGKKMKNLTNSRFMIEQGRI